MISASLRRGFTLLEIMIVISIGTLILGSCLPAFLNSSTERKLKTPVNTLSSIVAQARFDAMSTGTASTLSIGKDIITYGKERVTLEKGVHLRVRAPEDKGWHFPEGNFSVYPSGLCDPWQFEFSLADGSFLRTRVDPLTGSFEEEESFVR